jgi:hypothetical protein
VKPTNAFFNADIARKKTCFLLDLHPCLLRRHSSDIEVTSLTETMGRKINARLTTHDRTPITPETTLGLPLPVAPHRTLKNITPDNQQAMKEISVKELPRSLSPLCKRMRTD